MTRLWIGLGALAGLLAVASAAVAAHGLESIGPVRLGMVRSADQMLGWHALALLFCGAVDTLALTGTSLGLLAPIGGTLLMLGWALLLVSAWRAQ